MFRNKTFSIFLTSIEDTDMPVTISHPINKPLSLDCPLTSSWMHKYEDKFLYNPSYLLIYV